MSRVIAAVVSGYLFTYAATGALSRILPLPPADAVVVATLPAFALYSLAMLWAFAARNAWYAWLPLLFAVPLALVAFWPQLQRTLA